MVATLPLHRFIGARVVELGSGPGLVGLMLAKLGARVSFIILLLLASCYDRSWESSICTMNFNKLNL
jgi:tRNA1(Val) A37 N6-methylase TrmN6